MKIIEPRVEIIDIFNGENLIKKIEVCGRVCYKSENLITKNSARQFIKKIIKNGHESVLEHGSVTVKFITDRAIANEIVRHRIASYSQESTRYCNYKDDFTIICDNPDVELQKENFKKMLSLTKETHKLYSNLIEQGIKPEVARDILPLGLTKTELVMTANLREWRHFLKLRTSKAAHPKMQKLASILLWMFVNKIPIVFNDIATGLILSNLIFDDLESASKFVETFMEKIKKDLVCTMHDLIFMYEPKADTKTKWYKEFLKDCKLYGWTCLPKDEGIIYETTTLEQGGLTFNKTIINLPIFEDLEELYLTKIE